MARSRFGKTPADYGSAPTTVSGTANVNVFASITLYMFDSDAYATCVQKTDLLNQAGQAASSITAAAVALVGFQGPDGWAKDLYGCIDATPGVNSVFYRFPPSTDLLVDRVVALEAASASAIDDLTDVNTTGKADGDVITYVSATQTWVAEAPTADGGTVGGYIGHGPYRLVYQGTSGQYYDPQQESTVTARPAAVPAYPDGYVLWETIGYAAVTTPIFSSLADDGDAWEPDPAAAIAWS